MRVTSIRAFVAAATPHAWQSSLLAIQRDLEALLPGYFRWTSPSSWHLTLLFLGDQTTAALGSIQDAMRLEAPQSAIPRIQPVTLGAPGPKDRPRLVWLACDDGGALADLQLRLIRRLEAEVPLPDRKPFRAHITLGRARRPERVPFGAALREVWNPRELSLDSTAISEITLFRSYLERTGARYEPLETVRLATDLG